MARITAMWAEILQPGQARVEVEQLPSVKPVIASTNRDVELPDSLQLVRFGFECVEF